MGLVKPTFDYCKRLCTQVLCFQYLYSQE